LTVDGIKNIEDIRVGDWVIADDQTTPGEIEAKDLTVGSLLQTEDGRIVDVDRVEKREGPFEVYNFKVEGIPTYFVSELGGWFIILVLEVEIQSALMKPLKELSSFWNPMYQCDLLKLRLVFKQFKSLQILRVQESHDL
jgi:hypothetical protein